MAKAEAEKAAEAEAAAQKTAAAAAAAPLPPVDGNQFFENLPPQAAPSVLASAVAPKDDGVGLLA